MSIHHKDTSSTQEAQASYNELIKIWQQKTQEFFNDPKVIELMLENYSLAQQNMEKFWFNPDANNNKSDDKANPEVNNNSFNVPDNLHDAIIQLAKQLNALEQRIANLERGTK